MAYFIGKSQIYPVSVLELDSGRRDLCGSPSPSPLPKEGHLQQAAQDRVQAGLEYLQRRRLHNLPGQPVPVTRSWSHCYGGKD